MGVRSGGFRLEEFFTLEFGLSLRYGRLFERKSGEFDWGGVCPVSRESCEEWFRQFHYKLLRPEEKLGIAKMSQVWLR